MEVPATLSTVRTECDGNEVTIKTYSDGAMSLSRDGAEHFIYLHASQVALLKTLIG